MFLNVVKTIVCICIVKTVAFIDFGNGQEATNMVKEGRNQYQLLQERGRLPKYGECWQSALDHVHEGCRFLSEDTQSDIALHITNCFLEMSGHERYNCELDKKPNLRGICISSMTDRAFNVYTEFYTHTQNICWFLRGQIWQEKLTESTEQVGNQLKTSVAQQNELLEQQAKSLLIQEKLLRYGLSLERVLNESRIQALEVMEEIKQSTVKHQQLLTIMTDSLGGLKSWLIGEISWFDSLIFYISSGIIILVVTSTSRTSDARFPLLFILSLNIVLERVICDKMTVSDLTQAHIMHQSLQYYITWCRRLTIFFCVSLLLFIIYTYKDYTVENNILLLKIQEQNIQIQRALLKNQSKNYKDDSSEFELSSYRYDTYNSVSTPSKNYTAERYCNGISNTTTNTVTTNSNSNTKVVNNYERDWNGVHSTTLPSSRMTSTPDIFKPKYNLRSRLTPVKFETKYTSSNA